MTHETHEIVLNHNSSEFERIVQDAAKRVAGHLGDVREWNGVPRDDPDYFDARTGRGASDDDILDNVRDLLVGDLLDIPDHWNIAAETISDAASEAVHTYTLAEKLRSL